MNPNLVGNVEEPYKKSKTLCKNCEICKDYVYERYNKKDELISFQYCEGGKGLVKMSEWYITNDGYAYSTKKIYAKRRFFHTFFKTDKTKVIDHINGERNDNRLRMLREITPLCNAQNYHNKRTSKFPGVYWNKKENKWRAMTRKGKGGTPEYLGVYDTELEAYHAYISHLKADGRTVNTQIEPYHEYREWLSEKSQTSLV